MSGTVDTIYLHIGFFIALNIHWNTASVFSSTVDMKCVILRFRVIILIRTCEFSDKSSRHACTALAKHARKALDIWREGNACAIF